MQAAKDSGSKVLEEAAAEAQKEADALKALAAKEEAKAVKAVTSELI